MMGSAHASCRFALRECGLKNAMVVAEDADDSM